MTGTLLTPLEETRSPIIRPADFEAFWQGVHQEIAEVPLEWERLPGAGGETDTHTIDWVRFSSLDEFLIYGWLAVPKKARSREGQRGYLWLPGYSLGNPPPGPEALYPDTVTLGLNLHGHTPDTPYTHPSLANDDYISRALSRRPLIFTGRLLPTACGRWTCWGYRRKLARSD